jgi:DNA invertase Pin-like site-specific DNA recombinase
MKRVAIYARVSHTAGDQEPENQLAPLRQFAAGRAWQIVGEYVDRAPAGQLPKRTAWHRLRRDAARRCFDVVLVWKLDRAFRSVLYAELELRRFDRYGVAFVCATQPIDTSSSLGHVIFVLLAAFAQMERELISERTRAGLERAKAQGRLFGRPPGRKDRRKRHRRTKAEVRAEQIIEMARAGFGDEVAVELGA